LIAENEYGNNRELLTNNWQGWLNLNPFDANVAKKLATLYNLRISNLDPVKNKAEIHRINRKLQLARGRAHRYAYANSSFGTSGLSEH
jgi:hypothetical protein